MAEHCRALHAASPVLAGAVLAGIEGGAVGLRAGQDVVPVWGVAAPVDDFPRSVSAVCLVSLLSPCSSALVAAMVSPFALCRGPPPMRSRASISGRPSPGCVLR